MESSDVFTFFNVKKLLSEVAVVAIGVIRIILSESFLKIGIVFRRARFLVDEMSTEIPGSPFRR